MKKVSLILLAFLFVGFSGCMEDDSADPDKLPEDNSNTGLLVNGQWRIESGTIDPSIDVEIFDTTITVNNYWDLLAYQGGGQVLECDKNNVMLLYRDSTVVLDEGPTKCDPNDPQTEDGGLWFFMDNETKIKFSSFPFDPNGAPQVLDVKVLTESNLSMEMIYSFKNPLSGKETDHLIKLNYVNTK